MSLVVYFSNQFYLLKVILESKQHQNDWIDRRQHKRQTESQHFIDSEVDPRRMSVPTSEEQMFNNGIDPFDRHLSRRKRRTTSKGDEEGEDVETVKIEERVDPNNRTERLELDKSWLKRTTFTQGKSPLAKYVMKECGVAKKLTQRVVGGQDAEDGVYPWAVAVLKQGDGWCGGSILNQDWIITASHCFMS